MDFQKYSMKKVELELMYGIFYNQCPLNWILLHQWDTYLQSQAGRLFQS